MELEIMPLKEAMATNERIESLGKKLLKGEMPKEQELLTALKLATNMFAIEQSLMHICVDMLRMSAKKQVPAPKPPEPPIYPMGLLNDVIAKYE